MISSYQFSLLASSLLISQSVFGAVIPLNFSWTPAPGANTAPPYYIWQNDPDLSDFYTNEVTKVTNLCLPASVSNALIYEYAYRTPRASNLILPGITRDPSTGQESVNGSALVRHLAELSHTTKRVGTGVMSIVQAIQQIYTSSGYSHPQVKLIRQNEGDLGGDSVDYENRKPTFDDLRAGIANGQELIGSIYFMAWDPNQNTWIRKNSHAIGIYGMEPILNHPEKVKIYVSNPTRAYPMDFKSPVYDEVLLTQVGNQIEVTGRLLNFKDRKTVLSGLILMKP